MLPPISPTSELTALQGDRCRLGDDCDYCHFCTEQDWGLKKGEDINPICMRYTIS